MLTVRPLMTFILLLAVLVALVTTTERQSTTSDRARETAVTACLVNAPAGWNCIHHPTGYTSR